MKEQCTKAKYGKGVQRSEYQEYINQNKARIEQNKDKYRRRQEIVEHPYGTIKRQWGFSYIITKKGKQRASADVGLIFTAYLLKRIINILGKKALMEYLRILISLILHLSGPIRAILSHFKESGWPQYINQSFYEYSKNRGLYLLEN